MSGIDAGDAPVGYLVVNPISSDTPFTRDLSGNTITYPGNVGIGTDDATKVTNTLVISSMAVTPAEAVGWTLVHPDSAPHSGAKVSMMTYMKDTAPYAWALQDNVVNSDVVRMALDTSGDLHLQPESGKVFVGTGNTGGELTVSGEMQVNGAMTVDIDTTVEGGLTVTHTAKVDSVNVSGALEGAGSITVPQGETATMNGGLTATNAAVVNQADSINITGDITGAGDVAIPNLKTLTIKGDLNVNSTGLNNVNTINTTGALTGGAELATIAGKQVSVGGNLTSTSDVGVGSITTTGALKGGADITVPKLNHINVGADLTTTGAASVGTITTSGALKGGADINVASGVTTIKGNFSTTGAGPNSVATIDTSGAMTGSGNIDVSSGNTTIKGDLNTTGTGPNSVGTLGTSGAITGTGSIDVSSGNTTIKGDLNTTGAGPNSVGTLGTSGAITGTGSIDVSSGNTTIKGDLNTTGTGPNSVGAITTTGALKGSGDVILTGSSATFNSNLTVTGAASASTLSGTLGISGSGQIAIPDQTALTLENGVTVTGDATVATANVNGNLTVGNATTGTLNLGTAGQVSVQGDQAGTLTLNSANGNKTLKQVIDGLTPDYVTYLAAGGGKMAIGTGSGAPEAQLTSYVAAGANNANIELFRAQYNTFNTLSIYAHGTQGQPAKSAEYLSIAGWDNQNIGIVSDAQPACQSGSSTRGIFINGENGFFGVNLKKPQAPLQVEGNTYLGGEAQLKGGLLFNNSAPIGTKPQYAIEVGDQFKALPMGDPSTIMLSREVLNGHSPGVSEWYLAAQKAEKDSASHFLGAYSGKNTNPPGPGATWDSSYETVVGVDLPGVQVKYYPTLTFFATTGTTAGANPTLTLSGDSATISGSLNVYGPIKCGSAEIATMNHKTFIIDHPHQPDKHLVHATLEGPESAVFYRGTGQLVNGQAEIQLPDYFEGLAAEDGRTIILTNLDGFDRLAIASNEGQQITKGSFTVISENPESTQAFNWEVKATRKDLTPLEVEPHKGDFEVNYVGPYTFASPKQEALN